MFEQGEGFHRPLISLQGLAIDLEGRVYGVRKMSRPTESGYQMEGRVSIGGKTYRAFTSSRMFERPDGSLVDVGVFIVCSDNKPVMECLPPYAGWTIPSGEEVASWADDAAATGDAAKLAELSRHGSPPLAGIPHGDIARRALSYRGLAVEFRLKGAIEAAVRYEEMSEETIREYDTALAGR